MRSVSSLGSAQRQYVYALESILTHYRNNVGESVMIVTAQLLLRVASSESLLLVCNHGIPKFQTCMSSKPLSQSLSSPEYILTLHCAFRLLAV
jgi:hypothetical protein